ncbi:MAG: class I SAM-dependent methyltransferase [Bacilli bacterium]|nr:class I SAM-dependent methyltransferase [Bacilli bacterium]
MNEDNLIKYYNKFNEDKRLNTKHGMIEFKTAIHYIDKYIKENDKLLDVGAGTGKYSIYYSTKGYDVTAVELVKHNLKVIEKNNKDIKCILGNAIDLSKLPDNTYDITLLFGPMYHLISYEDKLKALLEAKRVTKKNGYIFISYCMNEYAVITHGFIDNNIISEIDNKRVNKDYLITPKEDDLYSFVRLEDINKLLNDSGLKRELILSQDGPTEYIKKVINKMDDKTLDIFFDYHLKTCERPELLGSGRHVLDILKVD